MLGPTISLGKVFGIPLRLHWTFSLLLAWVIVINLSSGGSLATASGGTLFLLLVFACVTLHELGHSIAAKRFGIPTRSITLSPIGGVAALDAEPRKWSHELWIALAGPAVNIGICLALIPLLLLSQVSTAVLTHPFASLSGFVVKLFVANFLLAAFNLLPAFPMDGGRVLRALLAARGDYVWATRVAARTGQAFAAVFALVGLFYAPFLVLIAAFLFLAAEAAYQGASRRQVLKRWRVSDVMRQNVNTVVPSTTIAEAAALSLRNGQYALPVIEDARVVAIIDRDHFAAARGAKRCNVPVMDFAATAFETATPGDNLATAIGRLNASGRHSLPVIDEDRLVGMLDLSAVEDLHTLPLESRCPTAIHAREATA